MKLDEFISEALTSIIKGVKDAQSFAKENNGIINPELVSQSEYQKSKRPVIGYSNDALSRFRAKCFSHGKELGCELPVKVYNLEDIEREIKGLVVATLS